MNLRRAHCLRFLREGRENTLRHFLGQMRIENDAPRRGINHRQMPLYKLPESILRAATDVVAQEFTVIHTVHITVSAGSRNRTEIKATPANECGDTPFAHGRLRGQLVQSPEL